MKKLIIALFLAIVPVLSFAGTGGRTVHKEKILTIISEYRHQDGVDVVRLGSLGTSLAKTVAKIALEVDGDPEAREIVKMIKGVKSIAVVDFEDAAPSVRDSFNSKLQRAFANSDLLMEVKDDEDQVYIYGLVDQAGDIVQDFVMYVPNDCALICLFGSISIDAVARLAEIDM